jgi:hypothetical protein
MFRKTQQPPPAAIRPIRPLPNSDPSPIPAALNANQKTSWNIPWNKFIQLNFLLSQAIALIAKNPRLTSPIGPGTNPTLIAQTKRPPVFPTHNFRKLQQPPSQKRHLPIHAQ